MKQSSGRRGTDETRRFYDEVGWCLQGGKPVDLNLFGVKEDGPIRIELDRLHTDRTRLALSRAGTALNVLECGCGGSPNRQILEVCSRYTGVDFSEKGVQLARSSFSDVRIPHEFQKADVCALPFNDGAFDAVYCANMIYHIDDAASQDAALAEMARVVRPGGVVVLIAANPYPLAFPVQLARGLARDTPVVGSVLNRIRSNAAVAVQTDANWLDAATPCPLWTGGSCHWRPSDDVFQSECHRVQGRWKTPVEDHPMAGRASPAPLGLFGKLCDANSPERRSQNVRLV